MWMDAGKADNEKLPIDRGYAWISAIASCGLFALIGGGFKTSGIILIELIDRYPDHEQSTLLWVFTACFFASTVAGPVDSYLISKLGHRKAAAIGILILSVGYVGLAYLPNIALIICFYSIPAGFGSGLVALAALLAPLPYFRKKKALAVGIVAGGSGLGQLVIPYILRFLFDTFGYSGALLLYSGFTLNFLCLACLLRPLSFFQKLLPKAIHLNEGILSQKKALTMNDDKDGLTKMGKAPSPSPDAEMLMSDKGADDQVNLSSYDDFNCVENGKLQQATNQANQFVSVGDLSVSMYVPDNETQESNKKPEKTKHFNFEILKMPKMYMIGFSIFFYTLGTSVAYQCVPSVAQQIGVEKTTIALIMSLTGVLEFPFRIINGFLADKKLVSVLTQYILTIFVAGSATLCIAIVSHFAGVIIALIGWSAFGTSVFNLIPIVLAELIGVDNVTSGMGLQLVFQSLSFLVSTTVAGEIFKATLSWRTVYYYVSSVMLTSCFMLVPFWFHKLCASRWKA